MLKYLEVRWQVARDAKSAAAKNSLWLCRVGACPTHINVTDLVCGKDYLNTG